MCGFAGIYKKEGITEKDKDVIKKMSQCIRHRGPDDSRTVFEENCALAFRRLSIIDLENGVQPFTSSDGRFEMTMTPFYDNYTKSRVLFIGNICHQVFGKWTGTVTLDDGTVLDINDMVAFCEISVNMW